MSAPAPGLRLGPYEIISLLGTGGMGEVWKARDTRLGRPVAVKFARERLSERMEKEARCIAQLNHSHICSIYDVGPDYLVMELVEGKCLRGPLPIEETLTYATQIADALIAAHEKGIVHRDLKPANILITKAGVKLLDFGVASQKTNSGDSEETAFDATQPGIVVGTLLYMAPEQLEGKIVDARADIFAFGALLYEAITGKPAFQFNNGTRAITPVLAGHSQLASTNEPLTSAALSDLIRTCLEEDPNDRWQSARELKHALTWINVERHRARPKSSATWIGSRQMLLLAAVLLAALVVALLRKPGYPEPTRVDTVTYSGRDFSPAVSPDGRILAFSSDRDGTPKIWLKQLDGGGEVALTSGPDDNPRFSPDGTSLLFARTDGANI
jgi:eukaryotic-like serine/threonine-protein kinase